MIYLTFGNQSAGIYSSYVTDVCKYWENKFNIKVRIIAFVSLRGYLKERKEKKSLYRNTLVLPQLPKLNLWCLNILTLLLVWPFYGHRKVIALSPIAGNMARLLKKLGLIKTYIYDSEGATAAEWNEYNVVQSAQLKKNIYSIERKALTSADKIRTVSIKMADYWESQLNFKTSDFIVIPCKLNEVFISALPSEAEINEKRTELGYSVDDIIFCYAGSSAGWQSLNLLSEYFERAMHSNERYKFIFLSDAKPEQIALYNNFTQRVNVIYVPFNQVKSYMQICDYGVLLRESSITNRVAAPTKFAEYLSCGLKAIISPNVGDYSEFTIKYDAGCIIDNNNIDTLARLNRPNQQEKQAMNKLAIKYFSKENFISQYRKLLQ